jgi:nitrite reductase (cytochrome c-552)
MQCHRGTSEQKMYERVVDIQTKNKELLNRAEKALVAAIDAINRAKAGGATDAQLAAAFEMQRKGTFFWDYIAMDNSIGFHAPQESARILGKAIDFARQAEIEAMKLPSGPTVAVTASAAAPTAPKK